MGDLIAALPEHDIFSQSFHRDIKDCLQFHCAGFSESTHYIYIIDDLEDQDQIWSGFRKTVRTHIRKAERQVVVRTVDDIERFLPLYRMTYERQGIAQPYPDDVIRRLDAACSACGARRISSPKAPTGRRTPCRISSGMTKAPTNCWAAATRRYDTAGRSACFHPAFNRPVLPAPGGDAAVDAVLLRVNEHLGAVPQAPDPERQSRIRPNRCWHQYPGDRRHHSRCSRSARHGRHARSRPSLPPSGPPARAPNSSRAPLRAPKAEFAFDAQASLSSCV